MLWLWPDGSLLPVIAREVDVRGCIRGCAEAEARVGRGRPRRLPPRGDHRLLVVLPSVAPEHKVLAGPFARTFPKADFWVSNPNPNPNPKPKPTPKPKPKPNPNPN